MDLLTLFGDVDENFYQLGLNDRLKAKDVHQDVKLMLSSPWKPVNKAMEEVAKIILKNSLLKKTDYYRHLKSYSEGLNQKIEDTAYVMLIPELVSSMSKWAPGLIRGSLGCSSYFYRNDKNEVVHGRVLDFPLQGSYDANERAILYQLNGIPKMIGFGSVGIPYPSITLMTEDGMTLALHQKFTNVFNKDGLSIFELIFDLVKNANDKQSVIDYLKEKQSITTWSLYMSFKNGTGLAIDLMGKDLVVNEFQITSDTINYFCNHLENKNLNQQEFLPLGFDHYNKMREKIAQKKINYLLKKNEKKEIEVFKYFTTPMIQKIMKPEDLLDFNLDPMTPSSLTAISLNPTNHSCLYLPDDAPKYFRGTTLEITTCFTDPKTNTIKGKKNQIVTSEDYHLGMKSIMSAQKGFDLHDPQMVYHHLQIAIDHLQGHAVKEIVSFYFIVAQYMYESHPKVLAHLLKELKKYDPFLPEYLRDHCLLFIHRLEKILDLPLSSDQSNISHSRLKNIYEIEAKIPKSVLHLTTKKMIFPRIDILDIIYIHTT